MLGFCGARAAYSIGPMLASRLRIKMSLGLTSSLREHEW